MASGPGKYDEDALRLLVRDSAAAVALIVLGGTRNSGSAMKVAASLPGPAGAAQAQATMRLMAGLFRQLATEIERDAADPNLKPDP